MPYWPSYDRIQPGNRASYLWWLSRGRTNPRIGIGYVFLFFYGLERRVLVDGREVPLSRRELGAIRGEVLQLFKLHRRNSSFEEYAMRFLEVLDAAGLAESDINAPPPVAGIGSPTSDLRLRAGLARFAKQGRLLTADWAQAWARSSPR